MQHVHRPERCYVVLAERPSATRRRAGGLRSRSEGPLVSAADGSRGARVEIDDVWVRRGDRLVVEGVSFDVEPGELIVVIGPSGSGKSTLLSAIARLIETERGHIRIDGTDVLSTEAHQLRRRIGYCFQGLGLFPHWTVADNVAVTPRLLGWSRERIDARVDALLLSVGLPPGVHRDRMCDQLSGGQAQRVAVARALAAEPPLLLLDEPFGALDPETRARLQSELLALHRQLGVTTLLVSHDLGEALLLGSRVAVLLGGRLAQVGTPAEIVASPASPEVRALIAPALERSRALAELSR